jgi:hypothetical protein
MSTAAKTLDTQQLEQRVKGMYEEVARHPDGDFHFETGRALAERIGYAAEELDRIPAAAIDSFAGVGHFLDLATIAPGETVLDLESGSGMDSFLAARAAGPDGHTIGVDMTDEQLAKATRLAREAGMTTPSSGRATRRFTTTRRGTSATAALFGEQCWPGTRSSLGEHLTVALRDKRQSTETARVPVRALDLARPPSAYGQRSVTARKA